MSEKNKGFNAVSAVKCLLVGVIGSVLLIVSYIILELLWPGFIIYNDSLRSVFFGQWALLIFLIPLFTGAVAAWSLSADKLRFNGNVLAGLISGLLGGIGFTTVLSIFITTLNISNGGTLDWKAIHDTVFPSQLTGMLSLLDNIPILLMFTLLSVMLSAIGGGIFFVLSYYARKGARSSKNLSGNAAARIIVYLAVVLLAVLLIPPALAFAGIQGGVVGNHSFVYPVTVQRAGADSLVFTNNGCDRLNDLDQSSPLIVYLSTGGMFVKDMTDQQAATKDKLNVSLDPASGLSLSKGSTLTITGQSLADFSYTDNATGKTVVHVMVIGKTTDGQEIMLLDTAA